MDERRMMVFRCRLEPVARLVLLALAGFATLTASAADDAANGERLVEQFVADVKSMSGRFEQQLVSADDEVTETSRGRFEILRPGRFRWEYEEPYAQLLVADGTNVWNYDVDLEQVTVKPQSEALGSTPAALLGGTQGVLDGFEVAGSFEDRGTVWVRLEPKDGHTSFETVELGFTDGVLTRMILSDDLDQTTLVALFDVRVNADLDPSRFRFTPPEGVDLVGRPAAASGR
jgi:outer membrane lipoprotein carrier protein